VWYLSFEKHREAVLYEGETLQEIAEKMIGDGYASEYLSCLEIKRDASEAEESEFRDLFSRLSKDAEEIQKREYERRAEECARPSLEWALKNYNQELPYLSPLGIRRAQRQAFEYLEDRFLDLRILNLEAIKEKYRSLLQEGFDREEELANAFAEELESEVSHLTERVNRELPYLQEHEIVRWETSQLQILKKKYASYPESFRKDLESKFSNLLSEGLKS